MLRPAGDRAEPDDVVRRSLVGRLALGGLAATAVAIPFTLLALLVLGKWEPLAQLDSDVANDLNGVSRTHGGVVAVLDFLAVAFDPWVFRLVVLAVVVWLFRRDARRLATWAALTVVVGGVLSVLLKRLVERARPAFDDPVAHANGYSFPSGHALNSFLCTGVLILVFLPVLRRAARVLVYLIGTAVVLLTGFDRVALGVHYVSDVVAGWIVALGCLVGTAGAFEIWRREHGLRPSGPSEGVEPEAAPELRG
ncbi:MAG: phosphatase PAP2 family protein [Propionibacteriales bacterium]|nr:phosphatase PAP2 family protein [Propionibacteriales bacterium]